MSYRWKKRRHTLSGRLMLLFVVMTALILVSVASTIAWGFRTHFQENIRPHLMQYLDYIQQDLGSPPDPVRAKALSKELHVDIHYFSADQEWGTNTAFFKLDDIHYHRQLERDGVEYGFGYLDEREYLVSRNDHYSLAFSVPRHNKGGWHKLIPLAVILLVLVLLYHATRRLFAPINTIKTGVARIGSGELSHRLDIQRRDELGELSESINTMADDIEQMLEAKRQLLLAISHELRSPLTRAKVSAAMLDDEHHQAEIQRDLDEMEALIEELLETERLSTRHHILNKSTVEIQQLIRELLDQHFGGELIELNMPTAPISLNLDSARIKLLLKNIIANALQHSPDDTAPPSLTLETDNKTVKIIIKDHGRGIEAEHLPHLTEPFYRTDTARRRETGGYGLGLYLCKVITEAHGGQLQIKSEINHGARVRVSLPRV